MGSREEETDPRRVQEKHLLGEIIYAALSADPERANEAIAELDEVQMDVLPPPDKYQVRVPGPARVIPPVDFHCPDCKDDFHEPGGGMQFVENKYSDEEWALLIHQSLDCRALKNRIIRWHLYKSPWAKVDRRWKSYQWRRAKKKPRGLHVS